MLTTSSDNIIKDFQNSETKSLSDLNNSLLSEMNAQNGINSSLINNNININNDSNQQQNDETNEEPEVDITISNVVSNFSVKCHLNLRQIANNGSNVVYRREQSVSH
jgi:TATA-box binding protein (TBP) (component of TFIID and TFIIIB)